MPAVQPATPLPDEAALTSARRRLVAKETKGSGVQSTQLTSAGGRETLGG